jgi:hypothetical protein
VRSTSTSPAARASTSIVEALLVLPIRREYPAAQS